ncbi:MAG: hypothetical protein JO159_00720 [Acidobacteria bacterium]|nr:hypothetical protein [Acidobacteriota bacterium]
MTQLLTRPFFKDDGRLFDEFHHGAGQSIPVFAVPLDYSLEKGEGPAFVSVFYVRH